MPWEPYLRQIEGNLRRGNATEHTHRPALQSLLQALEQKVVATNEPKRVACGAPDFVVTDSSVAAPLTIEPVTTRSGPTACPLLELLGDAQVWNVAPSNSKGDNVLDLQ